MSFNPILLAVLIEIRIFGIEDSWMKESLETAQKEKHLYYSIVKCMSLKENFI